MTPKYNLDMKLTKSQIKKQDECMSILKKDVLSEDEKIFILENYDEGAYSINSKYGAFFTPIGLARDFSIEITGNKIVDLCAGIGCLSYYAQMRRDVEITCIEINQEYFNIGKKILPNAKWINASVFDLNIIKSIGKYDQSISNPPFGKINGCKSDYLKYKGAEFEFKVIEIASMISDYGTFILPQMSTPYKYSGNRYYEEIKNNKVDKFINDTGFEFEFNCGIDTSIYKDQWKGVSPICEIVNFDFISKNKITLFD